MNTKNEPFRIRLKKLHLKNFKAFDNIEIEFPEPLMKDDSDVFVMGSKNGLGKTSVLEAISLLFLFIVFDKEFVLNHIYNSRDLPIDILDFLIKAGQSKAEIFGIINIDNFTESCKVVINRNEGINYSGHERFREYFHQYYYRRYKEEDQIRFFSSLLSIDSEPLILQPFMYFHSNRKVGEGSPELGNMVDLVKWGRFYKRRPYDSAISKFKMEILRIMMSKGGIFENIEDNDSEKDFEALNDLIKKYANGTIEKLRSLPDSKIELRIKPLENGPSFSFDALSSGQKEIISTLFLIWKYTQKQPGIILIDEPELHLNAEWQMKFIHTLNKLAPQNQYIFATHSEKVFSSVEPEYRILLKPDTFKEVATND